MSKSPEVASVSKNLRMSGLVTLPGEALVKTSEGFLFNALGDALAYYRGNYPPGSEHRITISDKPYRLVVYPETFDLASVQFDLF